MNMDLYGLFEFGDEDGVKTFVMAHRFAHEAEAQAVNQQLQANIGTYGIGGEAIIEPWIQLMKGEREDLPPEIADWLEFHSLNHQAILGYLGLNNSTGVGVINVAGSVISTGDLAQADFSDPEQMYQWLTLHQQVHDFEQQALGLA